MVGPRQRRATPALVSRRLAIAALGWVAAASAVWAAIPATAGAHGPIAPIASSYLAKPDQVPDGFDAKVVDGDQRMWLRAPSAQTVLVLDYRGAPYLRFTPAGIDVNRNSEMYYLNQTPVAQTPPANLTASTAADWRRVSGAHDYEWHDGRLHALATVAVTPGKALLGRWTIPVRINGRATAISGVLLRADNPSIVWFWPIAVLVACVLAAWRVRSNELDARLARVLGTVALLAIAAGAAGHQLHGRPGVGVFSMVVLSMVELAAIVALVGWGLQRVLSGRAGYFTYFAIAFFAIAEGLALVPTLFHGFALTALPAFVMRSLSVVCLGTGIGLLPLAFRMAAQADTASFESEYDEEEEDDGAWELG